MLYVNLLERGAKNMYNNFKHLNIPDHWQHEWTRYPQGFTILESLIDWVNQVDEMTDNVNKWNDYLNKFVEQFDKKLNQEVAKELVEWLNDGTLADIISDDVLDMKVDRTEFDTLSDSIVTSLTELETTLSQQITEKSTELTNKVNNKMETVDNTLTTFNNKIETLVPISNYNVDPTGEQDSLAGFKQALESLKDNETLVLGRKATYYFSDMLKVDKTGLIKIQGNGSHINTDVQQTDPDVDGRGLQFNGQFKKTVSLTADIQTGDMFIKVSDSSNIIVGDLLVVKSNEQFNSSRNYYKKGGTMIVTAVNDNTISIGGSFPYDITSDGVDVSIYDPVTVSISDLSITALKPLPAGRFGICVEYGVNTKLNNIVTDNFNHNITLRNHYNSIVEQVRTHRSYWDDSRESYGFSSYSGNYLYVRNSQFNSGRHAFEVSGFENSFNTTLDNVTAKSETGGISLNMHQACYGVVLRNSTFDSVGLANRVTFDNCTIGGSSNNVSNVKTSENFGETQYIFRGCNFTKHHIIRITDDAQNQSTSALNVGLLKFEDCTVGDRLQLNMSTTDKPYITDKLIVDNTPSVAIILDTPLSGVINDILYTNTEFLNDTNVLNQGGNTKIGSLTFRNFKLYPRYKSIITSHFDNLVMDNVTLAPGDSRAEITSKEGNIQVGEVKLINTDLTRLAFDTGGFGTLTCINSPVTFFGGKSSINTVQRATIEPF